MGPGTNEHTYWRLVLWSRHLGIVLIGVSVILIPAVGDDRFVIAAGIFGIVLPYDLALEAWLRRRERLPVLMPFVDLSLVAPVPLLSEATWVAALPLAVGAIALTPLAYGARVAVGAVVWGTAVLAVSGGLTQPASVTLVGLTGFAIAGCMTLAAIGSMVVGERALRKRITGLVSELDVIVWEASADAVGFGYLSDVAERVTGYTVAELDPDRWFDHVHPDDRAEVRRRRAEVLQRGGTHADEYRFVRADGETVWLHDVIRVEVGPDGQPQRYRGVTIDVTDRKSVEAQVELYANMVESIQMALLVARPGEDGELEVIAANPGTGAIVDADPESQIGRPLRAVLPTLDDATVHRLARLTDGAGAFDVERVEKLGVDPEAIHSLHAFPLPGSAVGICLEDVTSSALVAAAFRRQALHDGLTGLPNRALLRDRLEQALVEARRSGNRVALLLMDLDHFKEVNDALGHRYGDGLLVELSRRLELLLRECDTISRLGGDEFALLLTTNATAEGASRVVEKVRTALQEPFDIDGVTLQSKASIGVALYPDHADTAELLTQRADVAMYTAKRGGGGWAVYSPDHDRSSVERLTLLTELHRALEAGDLDLHYQPVIDVRTGKAVSSEALIRWTHHAFGPLDPSLIIELAELSGLILPLTRWVAEQAVGSLPLWNAGNRDLGVAINISVRNLYDRKLVRWLGELLESHGVPPGRLKVELTESEIMDDPVLAIEVLGALKEIGVSTSIDDFGTGYSSLSYLRRLPVTEIKIDQSFVQGMNSGEHDHTIVHTVIDLAHHLGMSVLAEGVEDAETLRRLGELGCDRAQGFLIGVPVPRSELLTAVDRWEHDVSAPTAPR